MQKIIKTKAEVLEIKDLSQTARELTLKLESEMGFLAGSFVNFFTEIDGQKVRRAYSISSDSSDNKKISISVRRVVNGKMSNVFWDENIVGKKFEIVGPLGLNTVDKIRSKKVFLFSFGIGVSVIKGILHSLLKKENIEEISIVTGNFDENEILYKDFFDSIIDKSSKKINIKHVLSDPKSKKYPFTGYIQDNISEYDFENTDIYICGRESHCNFLIDKIRKMGKNNINYLVEAFH